MKSLHIGVLLFFLGVIAVLPIEKAVSINLCATMGPAIKVSVQ